MEAGNYELQYRSGRLAAVRQDVQLKRQSCQGKRQREMGERRGSRSAACVWVDEQAYLLLTPALSHIATD